MRQSLAFVAVATFTSALLFAGDASAEPEACADPALSEAAAALLLSHTPASSSALVDELRLAGSNAVAPRASRAPLEDGAPDALLAEAVAREGALVVCGEAASDTERLRIVARLGGRIAASITSGGLVFAVSSHASVGSTELVVRAADGTSFRRALTTARQTIPMPSGFPTTFFAQLLGRTENGTLPVAELQVGGAQAVTAETDETLESHVVRIRRMARVAPLRVNTILGEVAARHAAQVCSDGRATHGAGGEDPVARVARAGLEARAIGEVVARAGSRSELLAAIDASASHRLELETDEHTDVGFGEATRDGHVCAVVVLASFPRYAGR